MLLKASAAQQNFRATKKKLRNTVLIVLTNFNKHVVVGYLLESSRGFEEVGRWKIVNNEILLLI